MTFSVDPQITYTGPQAPVASLTGSPLWGMSVQDVIAFAQAHGWQLQSSARQPTPYGLSPLVNHFTTPSGRSVLWIPSYGEVVGEDALYHHNMEMTFWILWQAGVRVLIVGGTSGIADWRSGDNAVRPGDVVLPWSFRTKSEHRGLPGTEFESVWSKCHLLMDDPFCPALAAILAQKFQPYVESGLIRRVRTPNDTRVALVVPDSITFETDFDVLHWLATSYIASQLQPDRPPVVTLHGDCVNPILARYLGIHMMYYHMVSNYAQGLVGEHDIAGNIHDLYFTRFHRSRLR